MLFVALYVSHSRSAYLAAAIGLGLVVLLRLRGALRAWAIGAGAVLVGLLAVVVIAFADTPFVSNTVFHTDPTEAGQINSDDQRLSSLRGGVDQMLAEPFGAGVGSTGSASLQGDSPVIIENQYLMIAHEVGWLGLALFLALFGIILWRLWRARQSPLALGLFASGLGLAAIGLVLPVWADDTVSILWWGLAGATLALVAQHKPVKMTKIPT
jgi:O-antigen ligase